MVYWKKNKSRPIIRQIVQSRVSFASVDLAG
jgi:hypothetical protein